MIKSYEICFQIRLCIILINLAVIKSIVMVSIELFSTKTHQISLNKIVL